MEEEEEAVVAAEEEVQDFQIGVFVFEVHQLWKRKTLSEFSASHICSKNFDGLSKKSY